MAEQEQQEIKIIEEFLPRQMADEEIASAVKTVIAELGAKAIKDMGHIMAALRERYAGQMDFGKASQFAKQQLS